MQSKAGTSWENVANWYDSLIGEKGGYFHTHVIFPKLVPLLLLKPGIKVLDIACGQGAWARRLAQKDCQVVGIDASKSLIEIAKRYQTSNSKFQIDDVRTLKTLGLEKFDRITCILALQNIDPIDEMFKRIHELLKDGGRFIAVIMHPAFRAPRISGWEIDEERKIMTRRIDRYLTSMKVPISMHPGSPENQTTWTFHRPLSYYATCARRAHLYIDALEEWTSDKESVGKNAAMENLARGEIPLFLCIRFKRIDHE